MTLSNWVCETSITGADCNNQYQQIDTAAAKFRQTFGDGDDLFFSTDWARSLYRSNSSRRWSYCSTHRWWRSRFSSSLSNTSKYTNTNKDIHPLHSSAAVEWSTNDIDWYQSSSQYVSKRAQWCTTFPFKCIPIGHLIKGG